MTNINDFETRDDDGLAIGKRYAVPNDSGDIAPYNVIAVPAAVDQSTTDQVHASVDNMTITDGLMEDTGQEDDQLKDEEVARMSEGYGYDGISRQGYRNGIEFDSIDRDGNNEIVGNTIK